MARKTYEEVKKFIENLGGILISTEYIGNSKLLQLKCPKCGAIFERNFSNIQQRKSIECKPCSYTTRAKAKIDKRSEEISKYITSLGGVLLKYNGEKKPLDLFCTKCDKHFEKTLQAIRISKNVDCKECSTKARTDKFKTDIAIIKNFIENLGGELVSEEFEHSTKNLVVKCNVCKREYLRTWKYIKDKENVTCPLCSDSNSLGADKIIKLLLKHNIKFEIEKTFSDCVDVGKLRFDFYIPSKNLCIEYDGKQHFFPYNNFGGTSRFEDRVKKDRIKDKYCKQNNIGLLRISYKQFRNIEAILIENEIIPSQAS